MMHSQARQGLPNDKLFAVCVRISPQPVRKCVLVGIRAAESVAAGIADFPPEFPEFRVAADRLVMQAAHDAFLDISRVEIWLREEQADVLLGPPGRQRGPVLVHQRQEEHSEFLFVHWMNLLL